MALRVGFDVGGTFTDFALQTPAGDLVTGKRLTTYPDPSAACLAGLEEILARGGVPWADLAQAVHGTTLGSNIVIERKGHGVALITTRGFRDVLIIGREKRYQVYDLQIEKPAPLIPRRLIREVPERMRYDGSVLTPLDEAETRRVVRELAGRGIATIAVCLLHSYVNPAHERRVAEIIREEAPGVAVSLSHEVSPTFREYERTSTTVVNAYVMTALAEYLRRLQAEMRARGYRGRLFVMQSSGGIATAEAMERYPVRMIESGPAAGALMAAAYGELAGCRDLIAFDMGGTTAKLALIENGRPFTTNLFELHKVNLAPGSGIPMNIQALDLVEIGAGGGSIARLERGVLAVGPESAGSSPGPACYGLGGAEPTVTDANLVLGYLNPGYFAGGSMALDAGAARRAIQKLAHPLGLSLEGAAWGIHQMVTANMELATRVVSIERGRDPRDLTFIAFGGAGPLHGCRLARALGMPRTILPAAAGVTAALGLLAAEIKFDVARTYVRRLDAVDLGHLNGIYGEMEAQAAAVVRESAVAGEAVTVLRTADLRYLGQGYDLTVAVPPGPLGEPELRRLREAFDQAYAGRYGHASPGEPVEAVNWKLAAIGAGPRVALPKLGRVGRPDEALKARRPAFFPETGGFVDCPVYDRYRLTAGLELAGPAIVEERESTTVLPPGVRARVDDYGSLIAAVVP